MENYTINKSLAIYSLKEYGQLTIGESRVLNSYICHIVPTKKETSFQEIPMKWITETFKLKVDTSILKAVETFTNEYTTDSDNKIKLFDTLKIDLNSDGEKCIVMKCSADAEKYFFNLSDYVKYDISNICKLKSHKYITFYELVKYAMLKKIYQNEKKNINTDIVPTTIKVFNTIDRIGFENGNIKNYSDLKNQFMPNAVKTINADTDIIIDANNITKHRLNRNVTAVTIPVKYKFNSEQAEKMSINEVKEHNKNVLNRFFSWNESDFMLKVRNKSDTDTISKIFNKYYNGCTDANITNDNYVIINSESYALLGGFNDAPAIIID